MTSKMAFLGLGQMGQAMSSRLCNSQSHEGPILLWNRTSQVAKDQCKDTDLAKAVETITEAVSLSDIVWSCLADEEAVLSVYGEICKGEISGKLFVECSTITASGSETVAQQLKDKGAEFVTMPVFGEPATARAGNLIVVPAGPATAVDRIRPYLEGCLAGAVIDFSDEKHGQASLLKIVGNVLIMTAIEQVSELMVFSEKSGLGVDNLRKLFAALYPGGPIKQHLLYQGHMASGEWARKVPIVTLDAVIGLTDKVAALAESLDVKLPAYQVARQHLRVAKNESSGNADILSIYGAVRVESGLTFVNSNTTE